MIKKSLIIILVILLAPSALGLALGFPQVGEIYFEPEKEVNLEYKLSNTLPRDLPVKSVLGVGNELSDYVTLSEHVAKVPANGMKSIVVKIKFPKELPYGVFPISYTAVEDLPTAGAFVANVGASHTITVINPYKQGMPKLEYKGPNAFQTKTANIEAGIRNIGKTDYETRLNAVLTDGNTSQEVFSERITIRPLESQTVRMPMEVKVPPGIYTLTLKTTDNKAEVNTTVPVGSPKITITKIKEYSYENPIITVTINNQWRQNLTEGTLALSVMDQANKRRYFEASTTGITLNPGDNTVDLRVQKPKFLENGVYPVSLQVLTPPHLIGADGELTVKLTEIGKMLGQQNLSPSEEPWEYELVPVDAPRAMAVGGNKKQIMLLIIVVLIAIFLFSIAMLWKRKKVENAQTPQPPQA